MGLRSVRRGLAVLVVVLGSTVQMAGAAPASSPGQSESPLDRPVAQSAAPAPMPPRDGHLSPMTRDQADVKSARSGDPDRTMVHLLVEGPDDEALQAAIEANGGRVRALVPGKADADVPADRVEALGADRRVTFVQPGDQYLANTGTVTSEGVTDTTAYTWHNNSQQGAGVNVAIVDPGGFQGWDTELGDELPASVTKKNFCGSNPDVFDSTFTTGGHGTEVAAIVHDMAPAAGIVLICVKNDAQLVLAKNYILSVNSDGNGTNDIRIVNGSFGNPLDSRGDGSGDASTGDGIVRTLRQNNVLFVAAAGNEADVHYTFAPSTADVTANNGLHLVSWAANNYEDGFVLAPGQTANFEIKWDAWSGAAQDFDLEVWNSTATQILSASQLDQTSGAPPLEGVTITNNTGSDAVYYATISRFQASANPRFDTYVMYASSELVNPAGSVSIPASSPYAMAAGANCVANHNLEPYSGLGPTIDGRIKPDISGPDGTSGQVIYDAANSNCTSGFTGTSAAAPHVAGAAALLRSIDPNLTADLLQSALQSMAVDAGQNGVDNQFGAGRLTLLLHAIGGPSATTINAATVTFVRGSDQALWMRNSDGSWKRLGGIITSDPDVTSMASGRIDVFGRGSDNALWHLQSNDNGATWGNWQFLGGFLLSGPGAVSWGPGRVDAFIRGGDNGLWHIAFANGSWTGWQSLGGIITSDPDVSSWGVNRLDVFARGSDNGMWHIGWTGSVWSSWESHGGGMTSGPGAVSGSFNRIDVFIRGNDGQVWTRIWNGSAWVAWSSLGGGLVSSPDPAATSSQLDLMIDGLDGNIWRRRRTGSSWGAWTVLGPPAFGPSGPPPPPPPPPPPGPVAVSGTLSDVVIDSAGQFAYVTNASTNKVDVIDIANRTLVSQITVGSQPAGLDLTPDGTKLYVANRGGNSISVVDVATRTELRKINVAPNFSGDTPLSIATLNDGTALFTTTFSGSGYGGRLMRLTLANDAIDSQPYGGPGGSVTEASYLKASGDHAHASLIIGDDSGGEVWLFAAGTTTWVGHNLQTFLSDAALNTDGSRSLVDVWVMNATDNLDGTIDGNFPTAVTMGSGTTGFQIMASTINVVDTNRFLVTGTLPLTGTTSAANGNAAVTPNGSKVVALTDQGVAIVSTANPTPVPPPQPSGSATVPIGGQLNDVVIDSAGQFAYVTNSATNAVDVVSMASKTVVAAIPVGSHPSGLDLTPDGTKLYVANTGGNNVSVVDVGTRTELRRVPIPSGFMSDRPLSVAIGNAGTALVTTTFAGSGYGGEVYAVNLTTDAVSTVTSGTEATYVEPSGDRSHITKIVGDDSGGTVCIFTASTSNWTCNNTNGFLRSVSVNGDGTKSLIDSRVVNSIGVVIGTISGSPAHGVAIKADGTKGYWVQATTVDVLNTTNYTVTGSLALPDSVGSANGRCDLTDDGTKLAVLTQGGLSIINA